MDGEEERDGDEECHHDIDGGEVGFADVQVAHREKESDDEAHGPASRDRRPEKENDEHGQGTGDGANPPADEVVQARACDGRYRTGSRKAARSVPVLSAHRSRPRVLRYLDKREDSDRKSFRGASLRSQRSSERGRRCALRLGGRVGAVGRSRAPRAEASRRGARRSQGRTRRASRK